MDINATRNVNQFIQLLAKTVVGQVDTFSQSAFRKILTLFQVIGRLFHSMSLPAFLHFQSLSHKSSKKSLLNIYSITSNNPANEFILLLMSFSKFLNIRRIALKRF